MEFQIGQILFLSNLLSFTGKMTKDADSWFYCYDYSEFILNSKPESEHSRNYLVLFGIGNFYSSDTSALNLKHMRFHTCISNVRTVIPCKMSYSTVENINTPDRSNQLSLIFPLLFSNEKINEHLILILIFDLPLPRGIII